MESKMRCFNGSKFLYNYYATLSNYMINKEIVSCKTSKKKHANPYELFVFTCTVILTEGQYTDNVPKVVYAMVRQLRDGNPGVTVLCHSHRTANVACYTTHFLLRPLTDRQWRRVGQVPVH